MKDFLTKKEISELKADHRAERELRYGDRIKTILMLNSGLTPPKVAEYLLLDETTVRRYSETNEIHVRQEETLNAENTIDYFKELEGIYVEAACIYIILDNAGYYKGKKIRKFLETSRIKLLYLPPYAPNLNLIERVWKYFKKKVLANRYFATFSEFQAACLEFFSTGNWSNELEEVSSLLSDKFQIIDGQNACAALERSP